MPFSNGVRQNLKIQGFLIYFQKNSLVKCDFNKTCYCISLLLMINIKIDYKHHPMLWFERILFANAVFTQATVANLQVCVIRTALARLSCE